MTYSKITAWLTGFAAVVCCLTLPGPVHAFQLTPPKTIVHKQVLPIKTLNFIRTKEGITYLISQDGRYVFQGALFDVWNGEQIESMQEMKQLADRVDFDYIGIDPDKMFTLDLGRGTKEIFIFADPNCGVCHKLLRVIKNSKQILDDFHIRTVIVPILGTKSVEKVNKIARLAKRDAVRAMDAFIENRYDTDSGPETKDPGLNYNILLTKALNIKNVPYLVNSNGLIQVGMPEELYLFLLKK